MLSSQSYYRSLYSSFTAFSAFLLTVITLCWGAATAFSQQASAYAGEATAYSQQISIYGQEAFSVSEESTPPSAIQPGILTSAGDEPPYAFVNVTVIPMNEQGERVLEGQTVIIRDDRITELGPAGEVEIPEEATRVEGEGRYLMPGLAEMHAHVPGPDNPDYLENILFLYLSNGVTTIRNMAGHPFHLQLREDLQSGQALGPNFYTSSPWMGDLSPEEAEAAVREYHEAGFDLLKIGSLSPEAYDQMAATANEIGIPFAGHIPVGVGLEKALKVGQKSIDHLDRYMEFMAGDHADGANGGFFGSALVTEADTARIPEAVEMTKEAGTWNVLTLTLVEHLAASESAEKLISRREMQYMPQDIRDDWVQAKKDFEQRDDFQPDARRQLVEIRRKLTKQLYEAGAPVALGSDAPQFFNVPGFSIHHEMRMMVDAGLTPYEVLQTGTRNVADYFGEAGAFGRVATGHRADLILLEENPLEDIENVQQRAGVMIRGKWLPEEEIQQRLADIRDDYN